MSKKFLDLPLPFKIVLVTLLVLSAGAMTMLVLGARAVAPAAAIEMQKNTAAVGRALSNQFALAVSAGIPIDRLNGVAELLTEVLDDNPTLRGIELLTADGRRLIQVGASLPSRDTSGSDWQGGSVTSSPIQIGQQIVGMVRVGGDARFVEREVMILLGAILALFAAAIVAMIELTRLIARRAIDEPVAQLQSVFRQVLAGQLPQPEPMTGNGAFAQAARRFQQLLRHVQDRFDHIAASARAIRGLDLDAVSGARLSELLEQVNGSLRPVREARSAGLATSPVWLLFFVLILAEMPRAILPGLMLERVGGPWRDLLPVLPLAFWSVGVLIGYLLAGRRSVPPGRYFLVGCGGLAAGFLVLLLGPGPAGLVVARLLAGLGVGVIWRAVAARLTVPLAPLAGVLVGGDLVGPILGNVLAESLGWPWLAAAGCAGVITLASLGYRSLGAVSGIREPAAPLLGDRWPSALAAGILSAILLQFWLPLHMPEYGLVMTAYAIIGVSILGGAYWMFPILGGWLCAIAAACLLILDPASTAQTFAALPLLGIGLGRLYRDGDGDGDGHGGHWLTGWSLGLLIGAGLVMLVGAVPIPQEQKMLALPVVIGVLALWSVGRRRLAG